jgi:hypothetical protein
MKEIITSALSFTHTPLVSCFGITCESLISGQQFTAEFRPHTDNKMKGVFSLAMLATDGIFAMMGVQFYKNGMSKTAAVFLGAAFMDSIFHLTGEVHSITQHLIAGPLLVCLGFLTREIFKHSVFAGLASALLIVAGFGMGFADGAPGMTPGYDVFKSPSMGEEHFFSGHIGAHSVLLCVPLIFWYNVPVSAAVDGKKAI